MSQGSLQVPTVGVVSGLTMAQDMNNALAALYTQNSGSSAPTNAAGGTPVLGQLWIDTTSATKPILKQYDGANWIVLGTIDVTNHIWTPPIGGAKAQTLSSGSTTDLGSVPAAYVTVSGVTTITSLGSSAVEGSIHVVTFSGILTLTHNGTSLILPTAANITTAAGDVAWFVYLAGGNWKCLTYQLASGAPLSTTAVGAQQLVASSQGMNAPLNLRINATVGSNALTIALKGVNGSDPSASNPVLVPYRNATAATGDQVVTSLQAALSFTVAAGNTLGTPSGNVAFRLWVIGWYNGGTMAVGLFNAGFFSAANTLTIYGLAEGGLGSTFASTNGGASAGTHYANVSGITNSPYRILGYLEWGSGLATAGTWASAPTTIKLFGPGDKKPGDIVQKIMVGSTTVDSTTNSFVPSVTLPSSTNGKLFTQASIIPTSACNYVETSFSASVGDSATNGGAWVGIGNSSASTALLAFGSIGANGVAALVVWGRINCRYITAINSAISSTFFGFFGGVNQAASSAYINAAPLSTTGYGGAANPAIFEIVEYMS